jgi:hypothetical protein
MWTDERVATLKKLHADPTYSYRDIGDALGVTRSTIAGKIKRLKLGNRGPRTHRKRRRKKLIRGEPHAGLVGTQGLSSSRRGEAQRAVCFSPVTDRPLLLPFADLQLRQCRWPFGEGAGLRFCGASCCRHHSYCEQHYDMAHRR